MNVTLALSCNLIGQGFTLEEADDHILILRKHGQEVAVFNTMAVRQEMTTRVANSLKEGVDGK